MKNTIYFIIFILALTIKPIEANDTRISISLLSHHITNTYIPKNINKYNELNLGLSIERRINNNLYIEAGLYKNSIYKASLHTGILLYKQYDNIEIGSNIGFVTGYTNKVIPFARPYIQINNIRLGYIPKIQSLRTEHVITLEYIITL